MYPNKIACFSFSDTPKTAEADGWVVSSESCGFLSIGARYVREVAIKISKHFFNFYIVLKNECLKRNAFIGNE